MLSFHCEWISCRNVLAKERSLTTLRSQFRTLGWLSLSNRVSQPALCLSFARPNILKTVVLGKAGHAAAREKEYWHARHPDIPHLETVQLCPKLDSTWGFKALCETYWAWQLTLTPTLLKMSENQKNQLGKPRLHSLSRCLYQKGLEKKTRKNRISRAG